MKIENLLQAIPIVSVAIKSKTDENIHEVRLTNEGRHLFMRSNKHNYWVLFKRETFHSFGSVFEVKGQEGESVNRDIFELAQSFSVDNFIFIYEDGSVFSITPVDIIDFVQKFNTKRMTNSGEVTYSFSTGVMKKWL